MTRDLTREEAVAFLSHGTRTGKLATAGRTGPTVVPIWFVVDGDDLVFNTGPESAKARRLRAEPRAAICVDEEEFPYAYVLVRGPVTLIEQAPDLLEWATRIARRYVPGERAEEFGRRNAAPDELLVRLHMERVVAQAGIAD